MHSITKKKMEPERQKISLQPSLYTFTNPNGQEVKGYWYTDKDDGKSTLTVQDSTGLWRGVSPLEDGTYRTVGTVNFIPDQTIHGDNNSELVVTPKGNYWGNPQSYRSTFHPEDTIEFFNTATVGGLNNLSPTQWLRRGYDTYKFAKGDMSFLDWTSNWLNGNNGVVSNKFAEQHPYMSTVINTVGDLGVAKGGNISLKGLTLPEFVSSGRALGLLAETKYGIQDRILALKLMRNLRETSGSAYTQARRSFRPYENNTSVDRAFNLFEKRKATPLTTTETKFLGGETGIPQRGMFGDGVYNPITQEIEFPIVNKNIMISDATTGDRTFMQRGTYSRNNLVDTGRLFRMGFTPATKGTNLPKFMGAADRDAISNTPRGSFISADAHLVTLPEAIEAAGRNKSGFAKFKALFNTLLSNNRSEDTFSNNIINTSFGHNNDWDMSASANRFFTKEAKKPGNELVYAGRSGRFNSYGTGPNKVVFDAQTAYENGDITAKEYVRRYNTWADEFGGRHGHVDFRTGKPVFYHPTIFKKLHGGTLK